MPNFTLKFKDGSKMDTEQKDAEAANTYAKTLNATVVFEGKEDKDEGTVVTRAEKAPAPAKTEKATAKK